MKKLSEFSSDERKERTYLVLDRNFAPLIYKSVYGNLVKCNASGLPIGPAIPSSNLLVSIDEVAEYDYRYLKFMHRFKLKEFGSYELEYIPMERDYEPSI